MKNHLLASAALAALGSAAWAQETVLVVTSFPEDMTAVIEAAFEAAHPDYDLEVLNKSTSSGV